MMALCVLFSAQLAGLANKQFPPYVAPKLGLVFGEISKYLNAEVGKLPSGKSH